MADNDCNGLTTAHKILEGSVKYRDGKRWKQRWCVLQKLSPVADCLHLCLFKDSRCQSLHRNSFHGFSPSVIALEGFYGIDTTVQFDNVTHVMTIVCQLSAIVLGFDDRPTLDLWCTTIRRHLGQDHQFLVHIVKAPKTSTHPGLKSSTPAVLYVRGSLLCLTTRHTAVRCPTLLAVWSVFDLRRFGVLDDKFCFEVASNLQQSTVVCALSCPQATEIDCLLREATRGRSSSLGDTQSPARWTRETLLHTLPRRSTQHDSLLDTSCIYAFLNFETNSHHLLDDIDILDSSVADSNMTWHGALRQSVGRRSSVGQGSSVSGRSNMGQNSHERQDSDWDELTLCEVHSPSIECSLTSTGNPEISRSSHQQLATHSAQIPDNTRSSCSHDNKLPEMCGCHDGQSLHGCRDESVHLRCNHDNMSPSVQVGRANRRYSCGDQLAATWWRLLGRAVTLSDVRFLSRSLSQLCCSVWKKNNTGIISEKIPYGNTVHSNSVLPTDVSHLASGNTTATKLEKLEGDNGISVLNSSSTLTSTDYAPVHGVTTQVTHQSFTPTVPVIPSNIIEPPVTSQHMLMTPVVDTDQSADNSDTSGDEAGSYVSLCIDSRYESVRPKQFVHTSPHYSDVCHQGQGGSRHDNEDESVFCAVNLPSKQQRQQQHHQMCSIESQQSLHSSFSRSDVSRSLSLSGYLDMNVGNPMSQSLDEQMLKQRRPSVDQYIERTLSPADPPVPFNNLLQCSSHLATPITPAIPVPDNTQHLPVSRVTPRKSASNLFLRLIRRSSVKEQKQEHKQEHKQTEVSCNNQLLTCHTSVSPTAPRNAAVAACPTPPTVTRRLPSPNLPPPPIPDQSPAARLFAPGLYSAVKLMTTESVNSSAITASKPAERNSIAAVGGTGTGTSGGQFERCASHIDGTLVSIHKDDSRQISTRTSPAVKASGSNGSTVGNTGGSTTGSSGGGNCSQVVTSNQLKTCWQRCIPDDSTCKLHGNANHFKQKNGGGLTVDNELVPRLCRPRKASLEYYRPSAERSEVCSVRSAGSVVGTVTGSCVGRLVAGPVDTSQLLDSTSRPASISSAITTLRPRYGTEYQRVDRRRVVDDSSLVSSPQPSPYSVTSSSVFTFDAASSSGSEETATQRTRLGNTEPTYINLSPRTTSTDNTAIMLDSILPVSRRSVACGNVNYAEIDLSNVVLSNVVAGASTQRHSEVEPTAYAVIDLEATVAAARTGREHARLRHDRLQTHKARTSDSAINTNRSTTSTRTPVSRKVSASTAEWFTGPVDVIRWTSGLPIRDTNRP